MVEIAHGFVHLVLLFGEESRIKPWCGIIGVELLGKPKVLFRKRNVASLTPGFPQIAAEDRALRFERCGELQILAALEVLPASNANEPSSQPAVRKGRIQRDRVIERFLRCAKFAFARQRKTQ